MLTRKTIGVLLADPLHFFRISQFENPNLIIWLRNFHSQSFAAKANNDIVNARFVMYANFYPNSCNAKEKNKFRCQIPELWFAISYAGKLKRICE